MPFKENNIVSIKRCSLVSTCITALLLLIAQHSFCQGFDTLHVFFPLDQNNLTEAATHYIDSLVNKKVIDHRKKITLLGYGDYLGSEAYNENLSYMRAKNIQTYLGFAGFKKEDIKLCIGKGKINRPYAGSKGNSKDRKVEIIVDKFHDSTVADKFSFALISLKTDEAYPLHDIHFYQGSLGITPESKPFVKLLYEFLNAHKEDTVQFEGHICCIGPMPGDEPYDESTLSQKRAELIRDSMVHYGIDSARIKCIGLGNHHLIYDEETGEENSAMSRRVEMRILSDGSRH